MGCKGVWSSPREWYVPACLSVVTWLAAHWQGFYTGGDIHSAELRSTIPSMHCVTSCPLFELCCNALLCCTVHWTHCSCGGYRQWSRKDQGQWWLVLLSNSLFVAFCRGQKNQWQCWHLAVVVSVFFGGMNRFKFGDTMVTDWVHLQGRAGSGEWSNFFWQLLRQFFGWAYYHQRWVGLIILNVSSTCECFKSVMGCWWWGQLNLSFFRAPLIILSDTSPRAPDDAWGEVS